MGRNESLVKTSIETGEEENIIWINKKNSNEICGDGWKYFELDLSLNFSN